MKIFYFLLTLSFIVLPATGQKIYQKFSDGICDCLDDQLKNYPDQEIDVSLNNCFEILINNYSEDLRNEFGDVFFDEPNDEIRYSFGIEVGKILARDCESFLSTYANQYIQNNNRITKLYATADSLYAQGSYEEAIKYYNTVIESADNNVKYYNSRGIAYFAKEDYYRAIADFIKANELNPADHLILYNLGYSKYRLNDYGNAFEDISAAIQINPNYCESHNLLGLIYNDAENPDSALTSFFRAYNCDSSIYSYSYNIGYIYYLQKDYKNALKYFERSYELGNPDIGLLNYFGNSYDAIGDYDKAVYYHSMHIEKGGAGDYVSFYNRALAYYKKGEYGPALKDLATAFNMDSTDEDVIIYLAITEDKLGNPVQAENWFNQAIETAPTNAYFHDLRGKFLQEHNKIDAAINDFIVSVNLYPQDCEIHYTLGKLYLEKKDNERANASFKESLRLGCDKAKEHLTE